ncbi:MAG: hypothetical protein BWZ00_01570 [Bacteroidetes bacterium ADurb.BinA174]|nr:MAG: hypothetical protein BWZ00_01570 [Bacteroidetes bacterium ADurb.BinA174]
MKDVKFIALPMNFTTTPYMRFVVGEHGYQAVGRIIALIEMLNEMDNEYNLKDKMQKTILARGLKFDSEMDFDKFIELVSTLPDFKIEKHIFSSRYIAEAQDKIKEKSVKAKKNIAVRWNKQKYDRNTTVCDVDTTVLQENTTVSGCIGSEIRNDTYNNITEDNTTEKKIIKNTTPHYNKPDDKTEVTYYTTRDALEIARTTYRREQSKNRLASWMDEVKLREETDSIKAEADRLFALEEGR